MTVPISLHCWQGDDVGGFENTGEALGGGLAVTGNYPGKARTPDELRADLDQALVADPRHATGSTSTPATPRPAAAKVERDAARPRALPRLDRLGEVAGDRARLQPHLLRPPAWRPTGSRWPTATRASAGSGSTTASPAGGSARRSARRSGSPCVTNVWIPDGYKDTPVDRKRPRAAAGASRSTRSSPSRSTRAHNRDAVEGKLFGLGSESYVVGSHEFYLGYAITRGRSSSASTPATSTRPRSISDKISAVLT